jgi:hypothetical protein
MYNLPLLITNTIHFILKILFWILSIIIISGHFLQLITANIHSINNKLRGYVR